MSFRKNRRKVEEKAEAEAKTKAKVQRLKGRNGRMGEWEKVEK